MFNINIGVLGHVDVGKTSLCRCLSEILSTCSLDKHKQSKERGITIDLGFSSFYIKRKNKLNENNKSICTNENINDDDNDEIFQICLVDCPGHHSLLKCIIMGAEITDMIFLLIDINKGIQKQTLECLVLCEIIQCDIIIILNKIDLIPINIREKKINMMKKKIENAINKTNLKKLKFYIVSIAADIKENEKQNNTNKINDNMNTETFKRETGNITNDNINNISTEISDSNCPEWSNRNKCLNINELLDLLRNIIKIPIRKNETFEEFYFLYDHCFDIKGKGIVFTGTVIKGKIENNLNVLILPINEKGKVKEIQSFKKSINTGEKGNRLSLLISTNLKNIKKIERGIIVHEKCYISHFSYFICKIKKVEFYKKDINNGELLKCIIGFSSALCYGYFFKKLKKIEEKKENNILHKSSKNILNNNNNEEIFDINGEYLLVDYLSNIDENESYNFDEYELNNIDKNKFNNSDENELKNVNKNYSNEFNNTDIYFFTIMNKKIYNFKNQKCIFLKDDTDINCRVCMYGTIIDIIDNNSKTDTFHINKKPNLSYFDKYKNFKILKEKEKVGIIEKLQDEYTLICKNMFHSFSEVIPYLNKKILIVDNSYKENKNNIKVKYFGTILKQFGTNGKIIIQFDENISSISENFKSLIVLMKYYKDIFTCNRIFI